MNARIFSVSSMSALCLAGLFAGACHKPVQPVTPPPVDEGPKYLPLVPTSKVTSSLASRSAGSLAISADDARLFAADADNSVLVVFNMKTQLVEGAVGVGAGPSDVAVAPDGTVWVTDRLARAVSVVDPTLFREVARIPVDAEPDGLCLTPDGQHVLVVHRISSTLAVLDVATRTLVQRITIPADASHVVAPVDGLAFVTHARAGMLTVVDLAAAQVRTTLSLAWPTETGQEHRGAELPATPVLVAGTGDLYVAHMLAKDDPTPTNVPDAYLGGTLQVPIVAFALARVDIATSTLVSPDGTCFGCGNPAESGGAAVKALLPAAVQHARFGALAAPVAAVADAEGHFLFTANELSANVTAFPTWQEPHDFVTVAAGVAPTGLALASTGDALYVHSSFDHTVTTVSAGPITPTFESLLAATAVHSLGRSPLAANVENGRRLFFAANDTRMTDPRTGGMACASCHPDGRDDGRTWQFTEGPRNTPLLAGRHLATTAPYHWAGDLANPQAFNATVQQRMGGLGLGASLNDLQPSDFDDIFSWLESLPPPDNPDRDAPSDAAVRGQALFTGVAGCSACHTGPDLTDNGFHDVGTMVTTNPVPGGSADVFPSGINTPSLFNVFNSAPYLHDGSIATLHDRLTHNPGDLHGTTSTLTDDELDDLVAYLQTL